MKDYQTKKEIIEAGYDKHIEQVNKVIATTDNEALFDFLADWLDNEQTQNPDWLRVANNLNHAKYKRTKRLRSVITSMLTEAECLFLTLTFTDETLAKTTPETRRRYVARYLKSQSNKYVANIDFGDQGGREHYHAVIIGRADYEPWHKLGAIKGEKIRLCNGGTPYALAKYIAKLTNHAIKRTTKQQRIIYSKE